MQIHGFSLRSVKQPEDKVNGMNPNTHLTVAIITYNEEENIRGCIESVISIADEILVLDSHSSDRTASIVKEYNKTVFKTHDFDGHVQQKNRAIEMSKGPWILSIDADERVSQELAASVKEFIEKKPEAKGARVSRLTWHLGRFIRHGGWYTSRYRLFRKGEARWGGENPHDEIFINGWSRSLHRSGPLLKGDLIHYSFKDLSHQVDTINKFSSIVAFSRQGKGRKSSVLKIIYKPVVKFTECYIIKAGFLDGIPGFIIAVSSAYSAFLKQAKLWELDRTELKRPSNIRSDYRVQTETPVKK